MTCTFLSVKPARAAVITTPSLTPKAGISARPTAWSPWLVRPSTGGRAALTMLPGVARRGPSLNLHGVARRQAGGGQGGLEGGEGADVIGHDRHRDHETVVEQRAIFEGFDARPVRPTSAWSHEIPHNEGTRNGTWH